MANKSDIGELYGLDPLAAAVAERIMARVCPFTNDRCSMVLRGSPNPTGVCSLTTGGKTTVVCRERFYGGDYAVLKLVINEVYGSLPWAPTPKPTKGQYIVPQENVQVGTKGKLTFDWILRRDVAFIAADILIPKFTGSYREALDGYRLHHTGKKAAIAASAHILNWDVEKAVSDIIRKSALLRQPVIAASGYYVILTDTMLAKIEELYEPATTVEGAGSDVISFRAYETDASTGAGIRHVRSVNVLLDDLIVAYYGSVDPKLVSKFKAILGKMP